MIDNIQDNHRRLVQELKTALIEQEKLSIKETEAQTALLAYIEELKATNSKLSALYDEADTSLEARLDSSHIVRELEKKIKENIYTIPVFGDEPEIPEFEFATLTKPVVVWEPKQPSEARQWAIDNNQFTYLSLNLDVLSSTLANEEIRKTLPFESVARLSFGIRLQQKKLKESVTND